MASQPAEAIVGIDLGTTFSVVAYVDAQGRPTSVFSAEGDLTTPSVVFLDHAGAVVGKEAVKAAEFEPDRVARHPKRDMGQAWFRHPVRGEQLPPEVLQAVILTKLKQDAEARIGPISKAVITVPAYFNEPRRRATQDAGRMAGLDVIDIINEPTAAAIAHGVQRGYLSDKDHPAETVLVYDLGGGTFDATLMRVEKNCFTVLATAGDVELGGIDWDNRIIDYVAEQFQKQHGLDPRTDPHAMQRLKDDAEEAKRTLTSRHEAIVTFSLDGKRMRIPIPRATFEELSADLLDRSAMTLRRLMKDAGLAFKDLTRLLAVGGSTRMPMVGAMLERETGLVVDRSLSPDEAVAHGAAIYATSKVNPTAGLPPLKVVNVCSHDLGILGIERATGMNRRHIMIRRNSPLPAMAKHRFGTYRDGQRNANVNVVEGGDAGGKGSTPVGKCVVRDLPLNLPKNTPIEVIFRYAENGRLAVEATMPTIGKTAETAIERAGGMDDALFAGWAAAVKAGLPDGYTRPGTAAPAPAPAPTPAPVPEPTPSVAAVAAVAGGVAAAAALAATVSAPVETVSEANPFDVLAGLGTEPPPSEPESEEDEEIPEGLPHEEAAAPPAVEVLEPDAEDEEPEEADEEEPEEDAEAEPEVPFGWTPPPADEDTAEEPFPDGENPFNFM